MPRSRKNRKQAIEDDPFAVYRDNGYDFIPNPDFKNPNDPLVLYRIYHFECPSCSQSEWESPFANASEGEYCFNPACARNGPVLPLDKVTWSTTPCRSYDIKFPGWFKCHQCNLEWSSFNAWGGRYQQCAKCLTEIYPYYMEEELEEYNPFRRNKTAPHLEKLCEKCQKTGISCVALDQFGRPRRNRRQKKKKKQAEEATGTETNITTSEKNQTGLSTSQQLAAKISELRLALDQCLTAKKPLAGNDKKTERSSPQIYGDQNLKKPPFSPVQYDAAPFMDRLRKLSLVSS